MKRFIYMQSLVLVMLALAVATMAAANVDSRAIRTEGSPVDPAIPDRGL